MEILKTFGFDPVMLVAQIINFLIIFALLKRFLYKPVLEMLKKREDSIKEGLKQAEESRITLEKTLENEKKIITKASEEGKKIIEEAKIEARSIAAEIEAESKKHSEKMILDAKAQIEQDAKEVEKRLSENVSTLALEMLTKSLEGTLNTKEQKQIVTKALKEMRKVN